ncbi:MULTISPECIES: S8 family peptidase [Bacillus]|uniref:S8 family peptidase n=1 Tax=Bacillus TaxID=1386 RepID=UPI0011A4F96F|nr:MULTISPECIES: S8 family serine peptidase [Bacillus]
MKKKIVVLLLLFILIVSIFGFYKWKYVYSKGMYGETLKIINAEDYLPYKENTPKIAIIDTGVDLNNNFLKDTNLDQFYLDEKSKVSQQYHGTMVAGILISNGDGYTNPGGLIPKSQVLSIQSGTDMGMTSNDLAKAIDLSVKKGAKVINISSGTTKQNEILEKSVNEALSKGVVIIAANGNDSKNKLYYPASYKGVISVGAINKDRKPINISDIGKVDIFAPGEELLTTRTDQKNHKGSFGGNSAATPVVTSIVAYLLSNYPEITTENIEDILINNSDVGKQKDQDIKIINVKKLIDNLSKKN